MPRTVPWHSASEAVYHNNSDCGVARRLLVKHVREGSAGKRLCQECARRNHDVEQSLHAASIGPKHRTSLLTS